MAFVQKVTASVDNASSIGSPSLTSVVSGNTLALILSSSAAALSEASFAVPTDSSGQTWTKAVGPVAIGTNPAFAKSAIYYLLNANAGTHTLSQSWNVGTYGGYTFLELPACTAVDVSTSNGALATVTTGNTGTTATTTQANDVVLIGLATNTNGTGLSNAAFSNPPAGYTTLFVAQDTTAHIGSQHSYKEVSSAGTQIGTWTWTTVAEEVWQATIATFKMASGGSTALGGSALTSGIGSQTYGLAIGL